MTVDSQGADIDILEPGPPVVPQQLVDLERALGATLPASLRAFLLRFNGGRPVRKTFEVPGHEERFFDIQILYGISRSIEPSNIGWSHAEMPGAFGDQRIPIGCTDTDDQILVDLADGSIWFWDYAEPDAAKRQYRIADSHDLFLSSLHDEK